MGANLSQIKTDSDWGLEASKINQNFNQVNTELTTLKNTTSVRQPLFSSVSEAKENITSPYVGQLVLIGSTIPAPIYRWNGSSWGDTGLTGGSAEVPLSNFYTKTDIDSQRTELELQIEDAAKKGGNKILEWKTDVANTRKQILQADRKSLLQISYKDADSNTVNEQYVGTAFTDAEWVKDSNWEKIPNAQDITHIENDIDNVKNSFSFHEYDYTTFWPNGDADKVTNPVYLNDLQDATHISFSIKTFWNAESVVFALYDENKINLSEYNLKVKDLELNSYGCRSGYIERPSNAKYVAVWAYQDTDYRQYEYIKLLKSGVIESLVSNINEAEKKYAKKESIEGFDKQIQIVSGLYRVISNCETLDDIWKNGFIINAQGMVESGSFYISDFIDVTNIEKIGFLTKNFTNVLNIAAYSDKDEKTFIPDNSIGNISEYEDKIISGVWEKNSSTKYIRLCMKPFFSGVSYPGFMIYKENELCYVGYNIKISQDGSVLVDGFKHRGYIMPYKKEGLYVDFELDANLTTSGQVYYKIYLFSKDFKYISKSALNITEQSFFKNSDLLNMLSDEYTLDDIGFAFIAGAFSRVSFYTVEDKVRLKRNLFSTINSIEPSAHSDKLLEAENIKCKNIESIFNIEYKDAIVVKVKNQNDLDNILFEHQEDGTKTENIKSGLYKSIEDNYTSHKNYIIEFYDGVYLLADANYDHGLYFNNNIFTDFPNVNLLFINAPGNNNVVLLSDGLQYSFNDGNISVDKRDKITGLKENFNLQSTIFPTHYAVEYKGAVDNLHLSKFVDDNYNEVEISSLKGITVDNCIYDYNYTWENNIGKFKLPSDLSWLNLTEQQCELTYCYFRCPDGYTSARGKVIKIEDGYAYISSQKPSGWSPYRRVKIYNLPILQSDRITIRKDNDGVTRIYLPNRKRIFECINSCSMLFYGRNTYKPNSIILYGLNIWGAGKYDRELNPAIQYHGEGYIASGGCNIRVNNCYFKNIGSKSVYIRDTEQGMNTEYCLVDNNKFFNTESICVLATQIKGITSINNNEFKLCGLNVLGMDGVAITASSEVGTYVFKNRITESNSSLVINASSSGSIVIVEDNYIKNSAEFIANYKKSMMMSDTGAIYSLNRSKAIIRNNYIDGVFGDWTYRVIYCDDGSWDKIVYGNIVLRADIENDSNTSGAIYFNPQSGEELKNSNNIVINNIISRRYSVTDAGNIERPCYVGKNLIIGIGAGQIPANSSVQNLENDIVDKQAIIQDGELYTELDVSKMFIRGEAAKHIHIWKDINK